MNTTSVSAARVQSRIKSRTVTVDMGHDTPCWISDRAAHPKGYTKTALDGKTWYTHRLAYTVFVGPIPEGLQIDHLCKQTACCNPDHLEPVTCRDNLLRGDTLTAREAAQTRCLRGHEFTTANTYLRSDKSSRECLTCRNTARHRRGIQKV